MGSINEQVARIVLRYVAAGLVGWGVLPAAAGAEFAGDPAVINWLTTAIGGAIAIITEAWFSRSVRK